MEGNLMQWVRMCVLYMSSPDNGWLSRETERCRFNHNDKNLGIERVKMGGIEKNLPPNQIPPQSVIAAHTII